MRTGAWLRLLACALVAAACTSGGDGAGAPTTSAGASSSSVASAAPSPTSSGLAATPAQADGATSAAATPVEGSPLPANAPALDFTARRLSGGSLDGVQLAGRDVALWMWAPWCPQCNREAPHVAEALAAWGDEVTVVGVAGHDTDAAHRAFVTEHELDDMVQLVDDDGSLWAHYGVSYQPAWVLIDQDGTVERVAGGLYDDLDARLRALAGR